MATGTVVACVLGAVVVVVVGVAMIKTGTDKGESSLCEDIGNNLSPRRNITSGSWK